MTQTGERNSLEFHIYRRMMMQPVHILNQMGVITSFSVAKKVSEDDLTKFYARGKKAGKSEAELDKILKAKIMGEIEEAIVHHKIPGLLTPQEFAAQMGVAQAIVRNIPELHRLIMVIGHKLAEKRYDKMSLCYFINSLANLMGLTESDFEKFHRQNSGEDDDGDDEFKDA